MAMKGSRALAAIARNLTNRRFLVELGRSGIRFERDGNARRVHPLGMWPNLETIAVPLGNVRFRGWNMDPMEVYCLMGAVMLRDARTIFEIGTYDGATTASLATAAPDASIYTLDLHEGSELPAGEVGVEYRRAGVENVIQLWGDSRTFDFSPWYGAVDVVIVDGGHEYDVVRSDSDQALALIGPNGVIFWDDYSEHYPSVVRAVDEIGQSKRLDIVKLEGTAVAVYDSAH